MSRTMLDVHGDYCRGACPTTAAPPIEEREGLVDRAKVILAACPADAVERIKELEAALQEADEMLWDALFQGAIIDRAEGKPPTVDNMCMSTYEGLCAYFEERGRLRRVNARIYEASATTEGGA